MLGNKETDSVIFIHPAALGRTSSGSGVRPIKTFRAFKNHFKETEYLDVISMSCLQALKFAFSIAAEGKEYKFAYFENLSSPHTLRFFRVFGRRVPYLSLKYFFILWALKKSGQRIFYYFRDAHWDFDEVYSKNISRKLILALRLFGRIELYFIKMLGFHTFYPSDAFGEYVRNKYGLAGQTLHPGGDQEYINRQSGEKLKLFYVGGCGAMYDPDMLFKAMSKLTNENIELVYCTRSKEWAGVKSKYTLPSNVRIIHEEGAKLRPYFADADVGICALPPSRYINLSFSVKVSEYLSSGLPVISYKDTNVGDWVEQNKCGWVADYNADALANLIRSICQNRDLLVERSQHVKNVRPRVLWSYLPIKLEKIAEQLNQNSKESGLGFPLRETAFMWKAVNRFFYKLMSISIRNERIFLKGYKTLNSFFLLNTKEQLLELAKEYNYHLYLDLIISESRPSLVNFYDLNQGYNNNQNEIVFSRFKAQFRKLLNIKLKAFDDSNLEEVLETYKTGKYPEVMKEVLMEYCVQVAVKLEEFEVANDLLANLRNSSPETYIDLSIGLTNSMEKVPEELIPRIMEGNKDFIEPRIARLSELAISARRPINRTLYLNVYAGLKDVGYPVSSTMDRLAKRFKSQGY